MKLLLSILFFVGFAFSQGDPYPLGGCGPGEVFAPDGGLYCEWAGGQFICTPTGECQSACYPSECADGARSRRGLPKRNGKKAAINYSKAVFASWSPKQEPLEPKKPQSATP